MKRKFTITQKEAIKGYYSHRRLLFINKSKNECLNSIFNSVKNSHNIKDFIACAGTFWFAWKDHMVTIHGEKYWWRMMKIETWRKKQNLLYPLIKYSYE